MHEPIPVLVNAYKDTLAAASTMPATAVYRQSIEAITNHRLAIVESTECLDEIEQTIGAGQIEQLVLQAENELSLTKSMLEWKPWESLEEEPSLDQWKFP